MLGRLECLLPCILLFVGCIRIAQDEHSADDSGRLGVASETDTAPNEVGRTGSDGGGETIPGQLDAGDAAEGKPLVDNGCVDTDDVNNFLFAGYVVYTDENGALVLLYDECKVTGPNGMLKEVTCDGYHGPETLPADLESKYIKCNCEMGECVEDSVVLCTNPEANVPCPGGSVWTNEVGKTHISVCKDAGTVDWYYCNEDGTFHSDASACDPGISCGDGMCGGFVCTDTEPPSARNPASAGKVFMYNPTTGESWLISDGCVLGLAAVNALACPLHTGTSLPPLQEIVKLNPVAIPCDDGLECIAGVCKDKQVVDPDPEDPDPEGKVCDDNDIEGDVYFSGTLILTQDEESPQYFPDKCSWFYEANPGDPTEVIIKKKVLQYSCTEDGLDKVSEFSECPGDEVCIEGACVMNTSVGPTCKFGCIDTDGGLDVLVGGSIYAVSEVCGKTGALNDDCTADPTVVKEQYCKGEDLSNVILTCPPEHFCRDAFEPARCVACQDSDPGDEPATFGVVDDIDGVHVTDFCNSSGQLKQAQCNPETGLAMWANPETCPTGQKCFEGKCK